MVLQSVDVSRTLSAGGLVFEALRRAIIEGDLKDGDPIRQDEIARLFNTSRIPVREAIARLESLRTDEPDFKLTWVTLISLYDDAGDFASALALAEQLGRDLPGELIGLPVESRGLVEIGRLGEAGTRARAALTAPR